MRHDYRRAAMAWLSAATLLFGVTMASTAGAAERQRQADERLQPILRQLDAAARDARAEAAEAARRGGDHELAERMNDFAKKVSALRERVDEHHASNDRLRHDVRDIDDQSRKIQKDLVGNHNVDPVISDRWARVQRLVDDLNSESRVAMGLSPAPRATSGDWRDDLPPTDRDRDRAARRDEASPRDLRSLADDLSDRAARLAQRRETGDFTPSLIRFRDEARDFDTRLHENPSLAPADVQVEVARLYQVAQEARSDLDRRNAPEWVRSEWNGIFTDVQRMRDMTGEAAAGTSGQDRGYAIDRDRDAGAYGAPSFSQLATDLDQRAHSAATLADQLSIGDASSSVSRFAEHVSRFTRDADTLGPEDRQERAKSLLDEARDVQRSLTKHNATPELMDQWNGVIDDLVQMAGSGR